MQCYKITDKSVAVFLLKQTRIPLITRYVLLGLWKAYIIQLYYCCRHLSRNPIYSKYYIVVEVLNQEIGRISLIT